MRRRGNRESGQVLLLGMIAMIVILLAIFLLFDLSTVIRGKVKAQNAVDAAALAGANWQRYTLNLLGELNLVKASTVLISDDVFGIGRDPGEFLRVEDREDAERKDREERYGLLKAASDTVSQIQQRVLFIVPLIGMGAAQQAAKNNGINYNAVFGDALSHQLEMAQGVGPRSSVYKPYLEPEFIQRELFGFNWQPAYLSVLNDILQRGPDGIAKGIAVLPNAQLLGVPKVKTDPPSSNDFAPYLQSWRVYEAIGADYWCWLRDLLRMDFSSPGWWGNLITDEKGTFSRESEFLPVNVEIRKLSVTSYRPFSGVIDEQLGKKNLSGTELSGHYDFREPVYDSQGKVIVDETHDDKLAPFPVISWAVYGWKWRDYDDDFVTMWEGFFRSPIRQHVKYYSGAVSRMDMEQTPVTITGTLGVQDGASDDKTLAEGFGAFGDRTAESYRNRFDRAQRRMRSGVQKIRNYAVAKPFGQVSVNGEVKPPHVTGIVLPVFDHSAIIPAALENPGRNALADWEWYLFRLEYLPVLGTVNSLDAMPKELQSRFSGYHSLLKKLDDPGWRQRGIEWLETPKRQRDPDKPEEIIPTNEDDCEVQTGGSSKPRSLH